MRTHFKTLGLMAGLAAGALLSASAAPTDNLRATYRNAVNAKALTNAVGRLAVQLGPGSGYYFTTNHPITYIYKGGSKYTNEDIGQTYSSMLEHIRNWYPTPVLRSTVGQPVAGETANKFLGEALTPPADWDGTEPEIEEDTGGKAVWIDFAKEVIAIEAGPIRVTWPLKDGSDRLETSVVSAAPNKRPVRLYWTHERPSTAATTPTSRSRTRDRRSPSARTTRCTSIRLRRFASTIRTTASTTATTDSATCT